MSQQYSQAVILRASLNLFNIPAFWLFLFRTYLRKQISQSSLLDYTFDNDKLGQSISDPPTHSQMRSQKSSLLQRLFRCSTKFAWETSVSHSGCLGGALFRWNGRSSTEVSTSVPNRFPYCLFHISHFAICHRQQASITRTNCFWKVCEIKIGNNKPCALDISAKIVHRVIHDFVEE